jgi:hypothetical protein
MHPIIGGILTLTSKLLDHLTQAVGNLASSHGGWGEQQSRQLGQQRLVPVLMQGHVSKRHGYSGMTSPRYGLSIVSGGADGDNQFTKGTHCNCRPLATILAYITVKKSLGIHVC